MKNYNKIFTTLDLSELDEVLIDFTLKMAKCLGSKTIYGAHIIPVVLISHFIKLDPQNNFMPTAPAVEKIRNYVSNEIEAKAADQTDLSILVKIEEGRPFAKLLKMTQAVQPDLLIFGKKEKSKGSGITAKRVAHNVDTDILLVPQTAAVNFQKILVPTDFSKNSFRAIQIVQQVNKALNISGKIDLLHILDASVFNQFAGHQVQETLSDLLPKNAQQQYEEFLNQFGLDESNFNLILQTTDGGNIANTLLQFAEQKKYDLIIIGARGHSYFKNFVFGSVAETLIDLTHRIPIFIIR